MTADLPQRCVGPECCNHFVPTGYGQIYCGPRCRKLANIDDEDDRPKRHRPRRLFAAPVLESACNPQPWDIAQQIKAGNLLTVIDDMHKIRRLYCRRYDLCLAYAAALNWDSFSCRKCNVRDDLPPQLRALQDSTLATSHLLPRRVG